ncbi:MAG: ABC transporter ATP-binding protein [Anaerolineaceae bacterium]|jgi:ABC-2 type transport system ATP-binding protein
MSYAIEATGLSKQYPSQRENHPAIENIDLSIPMGTLYGLVGPDGAGKTTALRILATVMEPTSGQARVGGFDVVRQAEKARPLIGYMPQAFSLYPDLTVMENLNFFADINGVSKDRRKSRIDELLDFTRLGDFTKRRSEHLSGGMRKKLALASALIHEPRVLLLDEPTTGVDPVSRRELWHILSQVILNGVTVLVSTPYMDEAERCNQVSMLYEGKVLAFGTPSELETKLPFDILEVKARPRKVIREVIGATEGIRSWRPVGDRLRLSVNDLDSLKARLLNTLQNTGAEVSILRKAKPTMDDVFIYMVENQRGRT